MKKQFRARLLQIGFVSLSMIVLGRVWYVQRVDVFLHKRAQNQWTAKQLIDPMRGSIYDSTGGILAFDTPAYDLDINLQAISRHGAATVRTLAASLSKIVHTTPAVMLSELNRPGVVWLRMYPYLVQVPLATEQRVLALFAKLGLQNDISPYKTYRRVYPDGQFASEVIGFTDNFGRGAAGVEYEYNKYLSGVPGYKIFTPDNLGDPIPFRPVIKKPVQNGDSLYLTLNSVIQHYAEHALSVIKQRFQPAHAAIIVANPMTGAILAMATLPNYNPNYFWRYPSATLDTNWAISDPFEPGSTFKPVTLTGALSTHSIRLNQTYMSGVDYVNGVPIRDWNLYGWGRLTYLQAFIYSSNVGFIHIGQAEGVNNFYHYFNLFGLNKPTGIDLPGEGNSIIYPKKNLNPVDFATMTFGQGLAVTPIQQIAAIGAIANGGHLMTPYVVQKIVAPNGHVVLNRKPHIVRRVASTAIMREVTNAMVQVVNNDPQGNVGVIPGYNIAGKTGTAEIPKPGGGYYKNLYNLSFVGFGPAHHPALEIMVTVNGAHHTAQWGDWVATPAAKYVLQKSFAYLGIPPHSAAAPPLKGVPLTSYVQVPNVVGMTSLAASATLSQHGLATNTVGSAGTITTQWPQPGASVAKGDQIALISRPTLSSQHGQVRVPNLSGMLMTEAMRVCASLGLQLVPSGVGYAHGQSIKPGQLVPLGTPVTVTFTPTP